MGKAQEIIQRIKEDTAYQEFFKKAMEKFKITTPADLKDPVRKKEFFDYVDKNYQAKSELDENKKTKHLRKVIREEVRAFLRTHK